MNIAASQARVPRWDAIAEKGDLSVSMDKYYLAAQVLDLTEAFSLLLKSKESLFDD